MSSEIDSLKHQMQTIREQAALRRFRENELSAAIDELVSRFDDCEKLIESGQYTPERALGFIRKQAERCVELKNRLLLK